jgi:hypothetical protein
VAHFFIVKSVNWFGNVLEKLYLCSGTSRREAVENSERLQKQNMLK